MTLIAAFRTRTGFVVAADSEENSGGYRRAVQKIKPFKIGQAQVIVAGSGIGTLIETFILRVQRIDQDKASNPETFRDLIEGELVNFYARDVATYQADEDEEKEQKFIIAAQWEDAKKCGVWVSQHCALSPVLCCEMAGVEDVFYDRLIRKLYPTVSEMPQAVLAGVYLMAVGKETSSLIGDPVIVAAIDPRGIWIEDESYVSDLEKCLRNYEDRVNKIFLDCADTSISVLALEERLDEFKETAIALHREHINRVVGDLKIQDVFGQMFGAAYPKYPLETGISFLADGGFVVEPYQEEDARDKERLHRLEKKLEEVRERLRRSASQKSED